MKKIITIALLLLVSIAGFAQNKGPIKFLGIPVDGPRDKMIAELQKKGFNYNTFYDPYSLNSNKQDHYFTGEFNGKDVKVMIHSNHNLVDRVYVAFPATSEENIKAEYNTLLNQFKRNQKYIDLSMGLMNQEIPNDEDISHEIAINNKRYEAIFYYYDSETDSGAIDKLAGILPDETIARLKELKALSDTSTNPEKDANDIWELLTAELQKALIAVEPDKVAQIISSVFDWAISQADGSVWFVIHRSFGSQYNIGLYYDNLHNKANGEDL